MDAQQNLLDTSVEFANDELTLRFSREMVTTDSINDVSIDIPRYWIWAIGLYDNGNIEQHTNSTRGVSTNPISLPSAHDCKGIIY